MNGVRPPKRLPVIANASSEVTLRTAPLHHIASAGRNQSDLMVRTRGHGTTELDI